jgi:hypothetical protein
MPDGASSFTDNRPLTGEFLLGYHCQRQELSPKKSGAQEPASTPEAPGENR